MHLNVLTYLMIYLAAMVLVVPLAKRFGLGVVLGYLLAGVALGPAGFSIASNTDDIKLLAELGVVLMLFSIGLELDAKNSGPCGTESSCLAHCRCWSVLWV